MRRGARRILSLVVFLAVVAAVMGVYWYVAPEHARQSLHAAREFLQSPKIRGFFWPTKQEGRFTVTYENASIPSDYAEAVLKIALLSEDLLEENLGRTYARPIDIYLFTRPDRHYFWNDGEAEMHLCFTDGNDLLPPGLGGERNHVAQIAHILAVLVACIESGGEDSPLAGDEATEALANYLEMNILVPGFWRLEGDLLWPAPYDYSRQSGKDLHALYAADPPDGLKADRFWTAWDTAWFRIDRHGGPETVGEVLNIACGPVGGTDAPGLARAVGEVTGDRNLEEFIRTLGKKDG